MDDPPLDLETKYNPKDVEKDVYAVWKRSGAFRSVPDGAPRDKTFTIVIPPPNVTGALHLGHALNNTLQDILIRYHRMRGFNTLWQPGTDHAGIATQAVVERRIRETEGKSRHDLGRSELVKRIWQWKGEYETRILRQLELMGCSCDWDRTRFTFDEGLSEAVRQQFFALFKDGLIFRGKRLVNWDTQLQTAVSDDEVYHETVKGHFWHFKYPVIDPKPGEPEHVIIATTRPETMLGDTAVAVHPDPEAFFDKRAADLGDMRDRLSSRSREAAAGKDVQEVEAKLEALRERRASHLARLITLRDMACDGRMLLLPLMDRRIPLIVDDWADPTKGSGCVKITPAHDPNDYEVGLRHDLPMINVLTADGKVAQIIEPDGSTNKHSAAYAGLTFSAEGRDKVVADLDEKGLLDQIEDHEVEVGHSDRSKCPIEPYLSDQWFVQTSDVESTKGGIELGDGTNAPGLAQAAIDAVEHGRIRVFPERYAKSYLDWLGEKRDWCISRQLWWGHRIPVWEFTGETTADRVKDTQSELIAYAEKGLAAWQAKPLAGDSSLTPVDDAPFTGKFCLHPDIPAEFVCELHENGFVQDPDVLDTWFSSALWPISTLGWPKQTQHLKQYYPTSVLCTGRDIITNWVARMVMFGLYAMGEVPFDHVYIHPKILDGRGETMSKSKGNGVDPVDIIETMGADALRYSMADMTTESQDIRVPVDYICPHCGKLTEQTAALKVEAQARKSRGEKLEGKLQPADCRRVRCANKECAKEFATQWADPALKAELGLSRETSDKFEIGRNFCNKLWNAARFSLMNLKREQPKALSAADLDPEDWWILNRLAQTVRRFNELLPAYRFSAAINELRTFFWDALCDWYIELTKPRMVAGDQSGAIARQVLAVCLDQTLRLFHPTIPFITERLWKHLNEVAPKRSLPGLLDLESSELLITAKFPEPDQYEKVNDKSILDVFAKVQDVTRGVRDLRTKCDVAPKERVAVTVVLPQDSVASFEAQAHIVAHMAGIGELTVAASGRRPPNSGTLTIHGMRIFVHDVSDDEAERKRTAKAIEQTTHQIANKEGKLGNEKFVANARPEVVEAERQRLTDLIDQQAALEQHLGELDA